MKNMKIGTHSGHFHCDEVLAIVMLRQLPEYKNAEIIRSRDPARYNSCDVVVDVGGVFDVSTNRYDHHQPSFNLTMDYFFPDMHPNLKLSSAGLVYAQFGHRIIASILSISDNDPDVETLFKRIYTTFISEVDAFDNGISVAEKTTHSVHTGLTNRIGQCNPPWNKLPRNEKVCFANALKLAETEFVEQVKRLAYHWLPARTMVYDAFLNRFKTHASGLIIAFSHAFCPFKQHLYEIEKEHLPKLIQINSSDLVFKDRPVFALTAGAIDTTLSAIPISEDQPFSMRVPLPETWAGKRDKELDTVVGLTGCVFVHSDKFLGKHQTMDGALKMAIQALKIAGYLD